MSPIQQMLLGAGSAVATKNWIDDCFSTFLYTGTGSARSINNGINLSESGGMVWTKTRTGTHWNMVSDTARGVHKAIYTNSDIAEQNDSTKLTAFNTDGFSLGTDTDGNASGQDFASWTFRKSPAFTICTWTGSGANRLISHDLGSIPGMILVKASGRQSNWNVYHRDIGNDHYLELNTSDAKAQEGTGGVHSWNNTSPTATTFSLGTSWDVNKDGIAYVAYVFAGGSLDRNSVDFDGTDDYLSLAADSDFDFGTGAYTIEFWIKTTVNNGWIFFNASNDTGMRLCLGNNANAASGYNGKIEFNEQVSNNSTYTNGSTAVNDGNWHHVAICRGASGDTTKLYVDGSLDATGSANINFDNNNTVWIARRGSYNSGATFLDGKISNLRVVKGTAVYTSAFTPTTTPLTNITNTVLLCCNGPGATASTVTPGTISAGSNPTESTDNPFGAQPDKDYTFGDAGDQNVISTGSYIGNGSSTAAPEINLGWEPQWVMVKRTNGSGNWWIWDSLRGIPTGGNSKGLRANLTDEENSFNWVELTSTGFRPQYNSTDINGNGDDYIFCAIRRPDGYVGKPPALGTGVFNVIYGTSSANPTFAANFPVDFAFQRKVAIARDFYTGARLTGNKNMRTNTTAAESTTGSSSTWKWDYMDGWHEYSGDQTDNVSWHWKRGAGFDCIAYNGDGVSGRQLPHSLAKPPEFIICKRRGAAGQNWIVGHKGLNGGTNPWEYYINLDTTDAQVDYPVWMDQAPTSTHFAVNNIQQTNGNNQTYLALLFSSANDINGNPISKVGSYTGTGSIASGPNNAQTTGFSPRFLMFKRADGTGDWYVFDTARGLSSQGIPAGYDPYLLLNSNAAQGGTTNNPLNVSSTGFSFHATNATATINIQNAKYIYYAHA